MTLAALLNPVGLAALLAWNFAVLSAVQLTIRLIMRFSIRETLRGTLALSAASIPVAAVYDLVLGADPSFSARLSWALLPMALMGLAGYATARWVLRFKRRRGQFVAGAMVALLAPHLFMLAP